MGRECFFIEDPTFTSVSVMNGNGTAARPISTVEPTQIDNLHSLAYILVFLAQGTLPWIGGTDVMVKEMKESSVLLQCSPYDGSTRIIP